MSEPDQTAAILIHTATITAAWLRQHPLATEDVPGLILDVRKALAGCVTPAKATPVADTPAVPLRRSVFPEHIVCLECGGRFRTLKRHLNETHQLGAMAYRRKWGLPATYPMLAPEYAVLRSRMTKESEMWRKRMRA